MLKVENLCLSFEGLKAVNDVTLHVEKGSVTALIGPNGAGKTTTFNLIAGFYKPDSGKVILDGEDITGLRSFKICEKGIGRTYQVIKLFGGMSVLDNILVGMHSRMKHGFWANVFRTKKSVMEEKAAHQKAMDLLENDDIEIGEEESNSILAVKKGSDIVLLDFEDIFMIRVEDKQTKVFTEDNDYLVKKPLYQIEENLDSNFVRVSKATIVNLRKIKRVAPSLKGMMFIELKNGLKDNISRKYLSDFKDALDL